MEQGAQPCHLSDGFTRHLVYKLKISFHTLSGTYWQIHLDNELETDVMSSEHLLLSLRIDTENGHVSEVLVQEICHNTTYLESHPWSSHGVRSSVGEVYPHCPRMY